MKPERWVCFERCGRLLLCWLALLLAAAPMAARAGDNAALQRIEHAEFILGDSEQPPGADAAWQPQTLLDDWTKSREAASGFAWYRARFDLTEVPQTLHGIGFSRLRTVGAVYVNGTLVGQSGTFGVATSGIRSQFYSIPPGLLRVGANTIHVRLWVNKDWTGAVSAIRVGGANAVQDDLDRARFLQDTVPQMTGVFSGLAGAFMLLIWLQRRQDSMFGYFGLAALMSAIWISWYLGYWSALPDRFVLPLICAASAAKPVFLFMYSLRFAGWRWRRTERAMWGLAFGVWLFACLVNALIAVDATLPSYVFAIFDFAHFQLHCVSLVLVLFILWRLHTADAALLAAAHVFSVATLTVYFYGQPLEGVNYGVVHLIPLLLVMGWILTRRFVASLDSAERLNVELEQRVERKHTELQQQFVRTRELEREQAVVQERARIMSDMHDGIGGQLITTLGLVEHGEASADDVATALRECIEDLRLAIDSLVPTDSDLLPVLGNLRYRLEGRLKQQGITLDWQVRDVPKLACLTPQNVLHVLRILQEAFTNILKHANASQVRVATAIDGSRVSIEVSDNGRGLGGERGSGHGFANMKNRARTIGGSLEIWPTPPGTTLSLSLPIG